MDQVWWKVWKVIRACWKAILAFGALLGILYLPQDIGDLPQAIKKWGPLMSIITRDVALVVFSALSVAWIIWIDVRPFVRTWWAGGSPQSKGARPIAIDPTGPDMTIGMALNYLLHQSEWGYDKHQWQPYDELDEALRVGAIRSWGQRCLTPLDSVDATSATGGPAFTGVTEKLTTEHWEHMKLIPRWIMFLDQPTAYHPHLAWMRDKECKVVYGRLKVNRKEIEEKWPPRR